MLVKYFVLLLFAGYYKCEENICEINACEALDKSQMNLQELIDTLEDNNSNDYLVKLERRLRSLEQPGRENSLLNIHWNYFDCLQCGTLKTQMNDGWSVIMDPANVYQKLGV